MRVLGLDSGLRTGWAIVEDGKLLESGVEDFVPRRGNSYGILFMEFRKWLSQMIRLAEMDEKHSYDLIAYEQSHLRGGAATEINLGMTTRIEEKAAEVKIECVAVHTQTLKLHTTSKGNATKAAMIAWAQTKLQERDIIDDNEADAIALAFYGYQEYKNGVPTPKEEKPKKESKKK